MRTRTTPIIAALAVGAVTLPLGCASTDSGNRIQAVAETRTPDALVHITGLSCPYCVYNVERSLQRVEGVARVSTDLNIGVASVWFAEGKSPDPGHLREAVKNSGFTPNKIVIHGETHDE